MDEFSATYLIPLLEIIWIDILLSGDNAVVIAMACRSLPANRRMLGIGLGAATAVLLRIVFATIVTYLLAVPYLRIAGGALLLWIAIKLIRSDEDEAHPLEAHSNLFGAIRTIAVADVVMSLDNVVAIAGAAKGHVSLFVIGLLISIPFVVGGASMLTTLIQRFPILIWLGGALLGWISGEMIVGDPLIAHFTHDLGAKLGYDEALHYIAALACALLVVATGHLLSRRAPSDDRASRAGP